MEVSSASPNDSRSGIDPQGSGVEEFDKLLRDKSNGIKDLMDEDTKNADTKLSDKIDELENDARESIENSDKSAGEKEKLLDKLADAADSIKEAIDAGKNIATSATPVLLSDIKDVKYIDEGSREVTLTDGTVITVDESANKQAFDIVKDFENQIRVVEAEGRPLLNDGYGLLGENELGRVTNEVVGARSKPTIEEHGDNIVSIRFTDHTGVERKYFAYNGHSQKAFDEIKDLGDIRAGIRSAFDDLKDAQNDILRNIG